MQTKPIADLFDRECCLLEQAAPGPEPQLDRVSELVLEALAEAGFTGGSVLEVGSGDGSLSRELVARGADRVSGLDLSPRSVEYATRQAVAAGLAERLSYRVADAAQTSVDAHDVVLSEKVFCCYPSPDELLASTLPAARSFYALALPESRGLIGIGSHLAVAIENGLRRLRGDPFRAYVHDVPAIERKILAAGFRRAGSRRHLGWRVLAYRRTGSPL